jgi:uncharacterized protein YndB with AHSA1/START domain
VKKLLLAVLLVTVLAQSGVDASAPGVRNTSYVSRAGERVLRIETTVPASVNEVWDAWTTKEGLKQWIAPVAVIDLKVGGTILTNYNKNARIGEPGTIQVPIINYIENQLITLKVKLNENFAQKPRDEDQNLQEIVQIVDMGQGKTKIISSMVGWGTGKDWDETYAFFERGNEWTYQQLARYLSARKH